VYLSIEYLIIWYALPISHLTRRAWNRCIGRILAVNRSRDSSRSEITDTEDAIDTRSLFSTASANYQHLRVSTEPTVSISNYGKLFCTDERTPHHDNRPSKKTTWKKNIVLSKVVSNSKNEYPIHRRPRLKAQRMCLSLQLTASVTTTCRAQDIHARRRHS